MTGNEYKIYVQAYELYERGYIREDQIEEYMSTKLSELDSNVEQSSQDPKVDYLYK